MPGPSVKEDPSRKRRIDLGGNDINNDNNNCADYEYVLVVPQKLTKHAQNVIYSRQATPLRYHLEGRFGSRTHRIDESHMGLPLTSSLSLDESKAQLEKISSQYDDLRALINSEGVTFSYKPYFEPASHRARPPPTVDARIHPEREPEGRGNSVFWREFMRTLKSTTAAAAAKETNDLTGTIHQINHLALREEPTLFTYAELFAGKTDPSDPGLYYMFDNDVINMLFTILLYNYIISLQLFIRLGRLRCSIGCIGRSVCLHE